MSGSPQLGRQIIEHGDRFCSLLTVYELLDVSKPPNKFSHVPFRPLRNPAVLLVDHPRAVPLVLHKLPFAPSLAAGIKTGPEAVLPAVLEDTGEGTPAWLAAVSLFPLPVRI